MYRIMGARRKGVNELEESVRAAVNRVRLLLSRRLSVAVRGDVFYFRTAEAKRLVSHRFGVYAARFETLGLVRNGALTELGEEIARRLEPLLKEAERAGQAPPLRARPQPLPRQQA